MDNEEEPSMRVTLTEKQLNKLINEINCLSGVNLTMGLFLCASILFHACVTGTT